MGKETETLIAACV